LIPKEQHTSYPPSAISASVARVVVEVVVVVVDVEEDEEETSSSFTSTTLFLDDLVLRLRLVLTLGGDDDISLSSSSCGAEVLLRLRLAVTLIVPAALLDAVCEYIFCCIYGWIAGKRSNGAATHRITARLKKERDFKKITLVE